VEDELEVDADAEEEGGIHEENNIEVEEEDDMDMGNNIKAAQE
jgi:hypothetical protein